jgi:hypothetical protein
LGLNPQSLSDQRFVSEYNEAYLKRREQALALSSLSLDDGGAGNRSFKGETLKNRSYENP